MAAAAVGPAARRMTAQLKRRSMRLSESIHYLLSIANCDMTVPFQQSTSTTGARLMSAQDCPRVIAFRTSVSVQGSSEDHIRNA
ncbi:hypothetical protein PHSY_005538 [Pseudozyma hubeiensis SY62]|uniref:Uncharacterized protein n=1 Tax=Pseudozyma hubeiensis (strain SY62) TaxID=1305764 RepID=R9PIM9_PSEHS|nr:hypothetical protein PHSY_005538 [Pseudozyma hubeiensis SY62]GAC97950.1 hypothetical protein PHSY_005538 [Pseudozyma hubeiensis SY62]